MTNEDIARELQSRASALAREGNNLYRIRAFRQAAMAVLALPEQAASIVARSGRQALEQVPGIGRRLADQIAEIALIDTGSRESPIAEFSIGHDHGHRQP